ncbi:MAG: heavy metal-binding domain-containing protein [Proteobacteria bacterium]|nr:heavy metal-binding domain-containing protein [Pseudomonadota bacterium]
MLELTIFLVLLVLGYVFGQWTEKRHFRSLIRREKETLKVPVITLKAIPPELSPCNTFLVCGNVVISIDYFKKFLSALRALFGGRLRSYETLLDRARREAILRMKELAIARGGKIIVNVRIETASISKFSRNRSSVGSVEVLAYGTAIAP